MLFYGRMIPKRCIPLKDDLAIGSFSGQNFQGVQNLEELETAMRCVVLCVHGVLKSVSPKIDDCCSIISESCVGYLRQVQTNG